MTHQLAQIVCNDVFNSLVHDSENLAVDAPPGAGKTHLVEDCAALVCLHFAQTSLIACHTNEQADDITFRLARRFPTLSVFRLTSANYDAPVRLNCLPNVVVAGRMGVQAPATITTTAKLMSIEHPPQADYLVIDEAYQLKHSDFSLIKGLAPRTLFIGDPGQIDPIVQIGNRHWADDPEGPHLPAPKVALRRNEARRFQLPLSRRLPTDSAHFIRDAFYPGMSFTGLSSPEQRRLRLCTRSTRRIDRILDQAVSLGSMAAVTIPKKVTTVSDHELIDLLVSLVRRLLDRRPMAIDNEEEMPLVPNDIGIVVSRREQVASIRQALGDLETHILVETANRFQGLERKVMLTLHPLSGLSHPFQFYMNPGRMCVSLSRHRVLCLLLTRDGIDDTLANYIPEDDRFLGQLDDPTYDGVRAHGQIWHHLQQSGRILRA